MNRTQPGSVRLTAGCHLYPAPDGTWRCALPDDHFIRLRGSDPLLRRLQGHVHGETADPAALAEVPELVDQLEARGLLATDPDGGPAAGQLTERIVHVEGDNPVADLIAQLLAGQVRVVRGRIERDSFAELDMAVSCAGWLPTPTGVRSTSGASSTTSDGIACTPRVAASSSARVRCPVAPPPTPTPGLGAWPRPGWPMSWWCTGPTSTPTSTRVRSCPRCLGRRRAASR